MNLSPQDLTAIGLSVKIALTATLLSLPLGFATAWLIVFGNFRGKVVLEVLVNLPLTLPPVVIGYFLLILFGRNGPFGAILKAADIAFIFTWKAAVVASATVGFPLLVRSIRLGMESIDQRLLQASRSLGASWFDTLGTVIFPLSFRGMVAGSSLMFARSLGEFGATIIVAGNIPGLTQTIPLAIYDYASSPTGTSMALSLCAVSVSLSVAILLLHEVVGKQLEAREGA